MPHDASPILNDAALLLRGASPEFSAQLAEHVRKLDAREWNVLVSGLCSVGKSSVVCALWGDAELLPTAVRDCTQTNTLIRTPRTGEADRRILLKYLDRPAAENFALKGLAFHRLTEMVAEVHGMAMPKLDEMTPDVRLRYVAREARTLYASRRDLQILNEPLTDELDQLENFIEFIDSPEYSPGATIEMRWDERREHLMGKRLPDGRLAGTGRLMALEHVELARETPWSPEHGLPVPSLIDTPWIPALHNARRADLILAQAQHADILLVLTLPQRYEPESWLLTALRKRPELARTTVIVFNQVDTCDPRTLFSREGFSGIFTENCERLARLGLDPNNMLVACSRLRFLKDSAQSADSSAQLFGASALSERIARLEKTLAQLREQARSRPESEFRSRLLAACDPNDAGVDTLRARLELLAAKQVAPRREAAVLAALAEFQPVDFPADVSAKWTELRQAAIRALKK